MSFKGEIEINYYGKYFGPYPIALVDSIQVLLNNKVMRKSLNFFGKIHILCL